MNQTEPKWMEPLRKHLAEVRTPQPGKEGLNKLMASLAEIEVLLAKNREEMSAQLIHFLERRSYDKAVKLCDGEGAIAPGTCGTRN